MVARVIAITLCSLTLLAPGFASAAVTLLVSEGVGVAAEVHGGGHASVYLSNVCSDDAVTVRLCRPGEEGVVLSTYGRFVPRGRYFWMAVPVSVYLYGIATPGVAPLYADSSLRAFLQGEYARQRLAHLLTDGQPDDTTARWEWPSMIGSVLDRSVYALGLETTADQDRAAVAVLNDIQRRGRFDLTYNNCSDFARFVINTYFPGAVHRDLLNDFTFTTPKAVAKSLASFAHHHPELGFTAAKHRQIEGPGPRSLPNRSLSEKVITSKKYLALTLATNPYVTAVVGGLYGLTRPFSFERVLASAARDSDSAAHVMTPGVRAADSASGSATVRLRTPTSSERRWRDYRAAADQLVREAVAWGLFADNRAAARFVPSLESTSAPEWGSLGELGLRVRLMDGERFVGLTRAGIVSVSSDPTLSYQLMLSTFVRALDRSGAHRPTLEEIADDWRLLQAVRDRALASELQPASLACAAAGDCSPPSQLPTWRRWLRRVLR